MLGMTDTWTIIAVVAAGLGIVLIRIAHVAQAVTRQRTRVTMQLSTIEHKLDAIIAYHEIVVREPEPTDIIALLRQGQKIQAIKVYRERSGADLLTAKNTVEEIARKNGM